MDSYGINLITLLFIAIFETISVAWVYGETQDDLLVISDQEILDWRLCMHNIQYLRGIEGTVLRVRAILVLTRIPPL